MILEVVVSNIRQGLSKEFEQSFAQAALLIAKTKGYGFCELKNVLKRKINIIGELGNFYIIFMNFFQKFNITIDDRDKTKIS